MKPACCGDVEALEKFALKGTSRWRKAARLLRLRSTDSTVTTQEKVSVIDAGVLAKIRQNQESFEEDEIENNLSIESDKEVDQSSASQSVQEAESSVQHISCPSSFDKTDMRDVLSSQEDMLRSGQLDKNEDQSKEEVSVAPEEEFPSGPSQKPNVSLNLKRSPSPDHILNFVETGKSN